MSKRMQHVQSRQRTRGLTLIEVLVALALGLVLIAGATNLFIGSSQTFRVNESLSRMQEEARFALNRMQADVRGAGYRSCSPDVTNRVDSGAGTLLTAALTGLPVLGWDYNSTGPGDSFSINAIETGPANQWGTNNGFGLPAPIAGNVVDGTDVLVVNRVVRLDSRFTGTNDAGSPAGRPVAPSHTAAQGAVILVSDGNCNNASIARRTNSAAGSIAFGAAGNVGPGIGFQTTPQSEIFQFQSRAYFIGADADGVPGLYKRRLDGEDGTDAAQELVRGVESMQVLYGIADSADSVVAAEYLSADDVDDWDDVVSVRIAMLMRSGNEVGADTNARIYNLLGTRINPTGGDISDPDGDRFLRVQATQTVGMRNRLR